MNSFNRNIQMTSLKYIALLFLLSISKQAISQQLLVPPYLQPGNNSTLVKEEKILIWQTDSVPTTYKVEYTLGKFKEGVKPKLAKVFLTKLFLNNKNTILYRARLPKLKFDELYSYRVSSTHELISENSFNSRSKKPMTRFVVFGDCGQGTSNQAQIAYQVYQQKPQFVLVTGDNVYTSGLEREYRKNFFPYYVTKEANPEKGAPLMNTLPFYMLVGNHDVRGADLDKYPDGLAYFYYNDLPLNAPVPKLTVTATGNPERVKAFTQNAKPRFPGMTNFSYDYGNVHIACLDANLYINPLDPALVEWLRNDLGSSKADWKIVAYHHPGFNSSKAHYNDQQMRLLSRLLEELKVDLVLTGHVHNYQRSKPLKFAPKTNEDGTQYILSPDGRIDGVFTLDEQFDGLTSTKPNGIIYIVTGAGGAALYDKGLTNNPDLWKHDPPENWVPFTVKMISDQHSFTLIETTRAQLNLKQLDVNGAVLDEITITR